MSQRPQTAKNRRLLTLLDALPMEGQHGISPRELADRMSRSFGMDDYCDPPGCKAGTGDKRLQRDLAALEELFGAAVVIKASEIRNRPLYWKCASIKLPGLDAHTALAFKMAGETLRQVLPPATHARLAEHFHAGSRALVQLTKIDDWHNKVAVLAQGLPLMAPAVDDSLQETIQQALFEGRQLRLRYRKKWNAEATDYECLSPAGLLVRGNLTYLVAFKPDDDQPRQFALHRVLQAERLYTNAVVPGGFALSDFVARGEPGVRHGEQTISMVLTIKAYAAEHLRETPLSPDQTLEATSDKDWLQLTATIPWTMELEWWLLGFGPRIKVLAPLELVTSVSEQLRMAVENYRPQALPEH